MRSPLQPGGACLGLTSQAAPVPMPFVLRVNRKATRVGIAILDYVRNCRRSALRLNNVTPGGRIRPDGTFSLRERFRIRFEGRTRERSGSGSTGASPPAGSAGRCA